MRNARREARAAEEVARRYDITVKWVPSRSSVPQMTRGPRGHGCSTKRRRVYFVDDKEFDYDHVPEAYLHEVVHVIVQSPWGSEWNIDMVPEDFLLLQFERSLARHVCSPREFRRVVQWQRETCVSMLYDDELGSNPNYQHMSLLKSGFKVARVLGLLDESNRPTFQWPDWKKLAPYRQELYGFFQGMGINPYPRME